MTAMNMGTQQNFFSKQVSPTSNHELSTSFHNGVGIEESSFSNNPLTTTRMMAQTSGNQLFPSTSRSKQSASTHNNVFLRSSLGNHNSKYVNPLNALHMYGGIVTNVQ